MKTIISVCILLIFQGIVNGQTKTIVYERSPNIEYQLRNEFRPEVRQRVTEMLKSKVKLYKLMISEEVSSYSQNQQVKASMTSFELTKIKGHYKDLRKEELSVEIQIQEDDYFIKDNLSLFELKELDEEQKILDYKCKAYTATRGDESYVFWVTKEPDIINGPAEFHCKEGLILQVDAKSYSLTAKSLERTKKKKSPNIPTPSKRAKILTYDEYNSLIDEIKKSMISTMQLKQGN